MDKCPKCGRKSIPKYKKYLSGPASVTSCEVCGAFIMISREAYMIIPVFVFVLIGVYLLNGHFVDNKLIKLMINTSYILGFIYCFEKYVKWLINPNMYK